MRKPYFAEMDRSNALAEARHRRSPCIGLKPRAEILLTNCSGAEKLIAREITRQIPRREVDDRADTDTP